MTINNVVSVQYNNGGFLPDIMLVTLLCYNTTIEESIQIPGMMRRRFCLGSQRCDEIAQKGLDAFRLHVINSKQSLPRWFSW